MQELLVGLRHLRLSRAAASFGARPGPRGLSCRERQRTTTHKTVTRTDKLHDPSELFHKSVEVSYIPDMAVDPELLEILACPHCKTPVTLVKNDATALKCDTCKRVYTRSRMTFRSCLRSTRPR